MRRHRIGADIRVRYENSGCRGPDHWMCTIPDSAANISAADDVHYRLSEKIKVFGVSAPFFSVFRSVALYCRFVLAEAVPAIDRSPVRRFERYLALLTTVRTCGFEEFSGFLPVTCISAICHSNHVRIFDALRDVCTNMYMKV